LRCVIDCSETFIDRPRDLKLQACTRYDYKQHNTVKYLIAITPDDLKPLSPLHTVVELLIDIIVQKSGYVATWELSGHVTDDVT